MKKQINEGIAMIAAYLPEDPRRRIGVLEGIAKIIGEDDPMHADVVKHIASLEFSTMAGAKLCEAFTRRAYQDKQP